MKDRQRLAGSPLELSERVLQHFVGIDSLEVAAHDLLNRVGGMPGQCGNKVSSCQHAHYPASFQNREILLRSGKDEFHYMVERILRRDSPEVSQHGPAHGDSPKADRI